MAPTLHAVLGASAAHRWMPCPGSIRMSRGMPNKSSVYAREGTVAHAVGEMALNSGHDAVHYLGWVHPEFEEVKVDESLCACVQEYLDCIRSMIAEYEEKTGLHDWDLGVEVKFDLTHFYPDMWGTCDCVIYFPAWKKLVLLDYKHGWISVPAEHNPQTMYYALGALSGKHNRAIDEVEMVIVQPRSGRHAIIKRWSCGVIELHDYMNELVASAERTKAKDAALNPGEWCKFCPAAPVCSVLSNRVLELVKATYDPIEGIRMDAPEKIPFEQLHEIWSNASMIESWIKNVKAYCRQQALDGRLLQGTKLVEGRSFRQWKDEDAALTQLEVLRVTGDIDGELFETKLKSPAQIEDMLPKKKRGLIEQLWSKRRGALTLVPEDHESASATVDPLKEFL